MSASDHRDMFQNRPSNLGSHNCRSSASQQPSSQSPHVQLGEMASNNSSPLASIYEKNRNITQQILAFAEARQQAAENKLQELTMMHQTYPMQRVHPQTLNTTAGLSSSTYPTQLSSMAPPPPPGPQVTVPPLQPPSDLLPPETVLHIPTRSSSARVTLGHTAVLEARKGLSRLLDATSTEDIQHFGQQLRRCDQEAVEQDWRNDDRKPIFAISYVQHSAPEGRFKFDDEQWQCFEKIVEELAKSGVSQFRVWLDQCLWLRDASQGSWAHTGLLPYVMWPVVSLGKKKVGDEKSVETETRMWPFLEEVAGLWGLGVIFAREMRSKDAEAGWREWMSYSHRTRLEPEQGMKLLLKNVFHGAIDGLQTGWQDDVTELKEMACANVLRKSSELRVGSAWRQNLVAYNGMLTSGKKGIIELTLPIEHRYQGGANMYIDGSRTVMSGSWSGIREWLSGDEDLARDVSMNCLPMNMAKVQVMSDVGEFEMIKIGTLTSALWLLVAMDGPTSNFSRGKVAWTKIMTGLRSCLLTHDCMNTLVVREALEGELQRRVRVTSVSLTRNPIEWE